MHRYKTTLLFGLLCLVFAGCDSEDSPDCFQKAGEYVTIERSYNGTAKVLYIEDDIEIVLVDSDEPKVVITGPKNLLSDVATEVVADDLFIRDDNRCNWVRDFDHTIQIAIHGVPPKIEYSGVGSIHCFNTLKMDYLEFNNRNGSGDVSLDVDLDSLRINNHVGTSGFDVRGVCTSAYLFNQGVNVLDASMLDSDNVFINSNSRNVIRAEASNYLFCSINNHGDVYVTGDPITVDYQQNGPGALFLSE